MHGSTTHASLLARIAGGNDEAAWEDFSATYGDLIRRVALRYGLQATDCDDIVQDVLLGLTRTMPGFEYDRGRGTFRGYLRTVVGNVIVDRFRQKRRWSLVSVESLPGMLDERSAEVIWEEEWRAYHVLRAMAVIEAEFDRTTVLAFESYARRGEPVASVASALGISVDRVYQAKSRILRRLSEVVAAQIDEEG